MQDFTEKTAYEVLAAMRGKSRGQREKIVRQLLYKKRQRPGPRSEQLRLLEAFSEDAGLSRFERTYALVAAGHKASEILNTEKLASFLPGLEESFAWAKTLPTRKELRRDGLHLRFSILNVLVNAGVLLELDARETYADQALAALNKINPRKTTHYSFNSTTNILRTIGVTLLIRPGAFRETVEPLRGLLYQGMRMKFASDAVPIMLRFGVPSRLADLEPESNFLKFEESFRKFLAIKTAAQAADRARKIETYGVVARECVAQYTKAQEAAHLAAIDRILAPHW